MERSSEKTAPFEYKGRGIFEPTINIKEYLFKIIAKQGPITRSELTKSTGIPRTTIYDTIVKLMLDEQIKNMQSLQNGEAARKSSMKQLPLLNNPYFYLLFF